jgi:hypothetical protein
LSSLWSQSKSALVGFPLTRALGAAGSSSIRLPRNGHFYLWRAVEIPARQYYFPARARCLARICAK